ncbi:2-amino-4-hydroxy-6-hydroxymethyldihydropteridine diphosphokinase [Blastochloris sulfoviridis]|uniref:2-amino-4-hydroxy-6-hydroxymethyldihydropteridine pyrophosphokinase n=1 Tax=Blastochloris sulfoviridis TaxID=50712 RepID=A0A5M6I3V7_9HYPH|nr:2-amino-4-hydroxy-6-hydroxymethyldihydropteridine diphosphokinase [Blastochloris sulfoviridis]KAA5602890.1 2-amino-4-hydroxy-6-hydroxymethyldihydropteridine diphosphokinase [Blastochloris sulfoviridis]
MTAAAVDTILGLGGNLGDVPATLDRALALLAEGGSVQIVRASSDWLTPPWGLADQPTFVNRCVLVETTLTPRALLETVLGVERRLGRVREAGPRWGPRPIDIDILAYDDVTLDEPGLVLPHPRLFERAFVLVPLAEIAPDRVIAGRRVRDALAELDTGGIVRRA